MCFGKFCKQQKKFWDTKIIFLKFFSKSLHFEGGGGQRQFGKSLYFGFFFWTLP